MIFRVLVLFYFGTAFASTPSSFIAEESYMVIASSLYQIDNLQDHSEGAEAVKLEHQDLINREKRKLQESGILDEEINFNVHRIYEGFLNDGSESRDLLKETQEIIQEHLKYFSDPRFQAILSEYLEKNGKIGPYDSSESSVVTRGRIKKIWQFITKQLPYRMNELIRYQEESYRKIGMKEVEIKLKIKEMKQELESLSQNPDIDRENWDDNNEALTLGAELLKIIDEVRLLTIELVLFKTYPQYIVSSDEVQALRTSKSIVKNIKHLIAKMYVMIGKTLGSKEIDDKEYKVIRKLWSYSSMVALIFYLVARKVGVSEAIIQNISYVHFSGIVASILYFLTRIVLREQYSYLNRRLSIRSAYNKFLSPMPSFPMNVLIPSAVFKENPVTEEQFTIKEFIHLIDRLDQLPDAEIESHCGRLFE